MAQFTKATYENWMSLKCAVVYDYIQMSKFKTMAASDKWKVSTTTLELSRNLASCIKKKQVPGEGIRTLNHIICPFFQISLCCWRSSVNCQWGNKDWAVSVYLEKLNSGIRGNSVLLCDKYFILQSSQRINPIPKHKIRGYRFLATLVTKCVTKHRWISRSLELFSSWRWHFAYLSFEVGYSLRPSV